MAEVPPDADESVVLPVRKDLERQVPGFPYNEDDARSNLATLIAEEDDPLIPNQHMVNVIWSQARTTWQRYLSTSSTWPDGAFNPLSLLANVPAIPKTIRTDLRGRAVWSVPRPGGHGAIAAHGLTTWLHESVDVPLKVEWISLELGAKYVNQYPRCFTILTLCWSYIFSATLLECQGSKAVYTGSSLGNSSNLLTILGLPSEASPALVNWLQALLAPGMSWGGDGRSTHPPWAMSCPALSEVHPVVQKDGSQAPNSDEAVELLIELCDLLHLHQSSSQTSVPSVEAALMAVLAIPHHRLTKLTIQLPTPSIKAAPQDPNPLALSTLAYCKHRAYFMTLSLHQGFLMPTIWTVFWQPNIPSTLVSPWFAGIQFVLRPLLNNRDVEGLLRLFMRRRPRVGLLWLGVLFLGDHQTLLDRMDDFLQGFAAPFDPYFYGRPDFLVEPWTRLPHSFWDHDLDERGNYIKPSTTTKDGVSVPLPHGYYHRNEVLQRRLNLRLIKMREDREDYREQIRVFNSNLPSILCAWEPPSDPIHHDDIEPDVDMHAPFWRDYVCWQWARPGGNDKGFRRDHPEITVNVLPDDVELAPPPTKDDHDYPVQARDIFLGPSKSATINTVRSCCINSSGRITLATAAIPRLDHGHPWIPQLLADDPRWKDRNPRV